LVAADVATIFVPKNFRDLIKMHPQNRGRPLVMFYTGSSASVMM